MANAELSKLSIRYFERDLVLNRFDPDLTDENLNRTTKRKDRPAPEVLPFRGVIQPAGKNTVNQFTLEEGQRTEGMFTLHTETEVFAASFEDGRSFADIVIYKGKGYEVDQVQDQVEGDTFWRALLKRFIENRDNDGERFVYSGTIVDKNGLPLP